MATLQEQQATYNAVNTALAEGNVRHANHYLQILRDQLALGDPVPAGGKLSIIRRLQTRMAATVESLVRECNTYL